MAGRREGRDKGKMRWETIIGKLFEAGLYEYEKGFDEVGAKIKVRIPGTDEAIIGYLPLDDCYDVKFAEFLIKEVNKRRCWR